MQRIGLAFIGLLVIAGVAISAHGCITAMNEDDAIVERQRLEDVRFTDACHAAGGFVLRDQWNVHPTDCKIIPR